MKVPSTHSCRLASALLGFTLVLAGCGGGKKGGQAGAKKPEVKSLEVSPEGEVKLAFAQTSAGYECFLTSNIRQTPAVACDPSNSVYRVALLPGETGAKVVVQSSATREQVASYPVEAARVAPITSPSDLPADPRLGPELPVEGLGNPDGTFNLGSNHIVNLPVDQMGRPLMRVLAYSEEIGANSMQLVQIAARDLDPLGKSDVASQALNLPGVDTRSFLVSSGLQDPNGAIETAYNRITMPTLSLDRPVF